MADAFGRLVSLFSTRTILLLTRVFHRFGWMSQYQPLPHVSFGGASFSSRIYGRLDAIRDNLGSGHHFGMDIGCNNGFYVFSLAGPDRLMYGIEGADDIFQVFLAAKRMFTPGNVIPLNMYVTPDNARGLPECDFTILMAVFHHWARLYGEGPALDMLSTVLQKTRQTLFFEVPFARDSGANYRDCLPDRDADDPEQWWRAWFATQGWTSMAPIFQLNRTLYRIDQSTPSAGSNL
ncbi:MAG: hypothetical protein HKN28_04015 [Alphaproteobacteria bacterium]|nr:hypothetical protein [Alphaproteobacteria bacterium]